MTDPRTALVEAFKVVHGYKRREKRSGVWEWHPLWLLFKRFLDAEAWTSAAEMLIPTDGSMALLDIEYSYEPAQPGVWSACTIRWYPPHKSGNDWHAQIESGPIPAIALATAALKAKEQQP